MTRPLRSAFLIAVALALVSATTAADIVDVLTCGEKDAECGSGSEPVQDEGACDHCPSCVVSHGHLQSILVRVDVEVPPAASSGFIALAL